MQSSQKPDHLSCLPNIGIVSFHPLTQWLKKKKKKEKFLGKDRF